MLFNLKYTNLFIFSIPLNILSVPEGMTISLEKGIPQLCNWDINSKEKVHHLFHFHKPKICRLNSYVSINKYEVEMQVGVPYVFFHCFSYSFSLPLVIGILNLPLFLVELLCSKWASVSKAALLPFIFYTKCNN